MFGRFQAGLNGSGEKKDIFSPAKGRPNIYIYRRWKLGNIYFFNFFIIIVELLNFTPCLATDKQKKGSFLF